MNNLNQKQKIGLIYQLILSFLTLAALILMFVESSFAMLFYIILALLFFILAFNNHYIYQRKYFTYIYLLLFAMSLLRAFL